MTKRYNVDYFAALGFMAFGVFMLINALRFKQVSLEMVIGSEFMPRLIAVLIILLSGTLWIRSLKAKRAEVPQGIAVGQPRRKSNKFSVYGTFVLLGIYVLLLESVGFIVMTIPYLFLQMNLMTDQEKRRPILFGVIAIVVTLVIEYIFNTFFYLMLPEGILS